MSSVGRGEEDHRGLLVSPLSEEGKSAGWMAQEPGPLPSLSRETQLQPGASATRDLACPGNW